jgi:mutator protein MutT
VVQHNIPRPALFSFEDATDDIARISSGLRSIAPSDFEEVLKNKLSDKYDWPKESEITDQVGPPKFFNPYLYSKDDLTYPKLSAVLIPFIATDSEVRIIFTKRSKELRNHSGQISFPGGKREEDETPDQTAIRETFEEIGVHPDLISTLGQLNFTYTLGNMSLIVPVVGTLTQKSEYRLSQEVTEVFDVGVLDLISEDVYSRETWSFSKEYVREMHFFKIEGHVIWGATARILYDLLDLIAS